LLSNFEFFVCTMARASVMGYSTPSGSRKRDFGLSFSIYLWRDNLSKELRNQGKLAPRKSSLILASLR